MLLRYNCSFSPPNGKKIGLIFRFRKHQKKQDRRHPLVAMEKDPLPSGVHIIDCAKNSLNDLLTKLFVMEGENAQETQCEDMIAEECFSQVCVHGQCNDLLI